MKKIYIFIYMLIKTEYTGIFKLKTFRQQSLSISRLYRSTVYMSIYIYIYIFKIYPNVQLEPKNTNIYSICNF